MSETVSFHVPAQFDGERVDKLVAATVARMSRSAIQKVILEGGVLVNGSPVGKSARIAAEDLVEMRIPAPQLPDMQPEAIPLDIRYEDEWLLVVNKPQGMVVHPAPGHFSGTLVNALLAHCAGGLSGINGVLRPGIVHRIDKDTSGLLIVAKNDQAHKSLAKQIQAHSFQREYRAVVHGVLRERSGVVDAPVGRHPEQRKKMAVTQKNAKPARTHYEVLEQYERFTFVKLRLETGRTHQIRVHMAYLGHPVAGDPVYGPKKPAPGLQGQCLHAGMIGFIHPATGAYLEVESELPPYFTQFLKRISR